MKHHETVRYEHCTKCGSTDVKNLVHIRRGKPIRVYVKCAKCGAYVCRYTLRRYTSDQPYESLLKILCKCEPHHQSARELLDMVETFTKSISDEFERLVQMAEKEDPRRMEQIIAEEKPQTD